MENRVGKKKRLGVAGDLRQQFLDAWLRRFREEDGLEAEPGADGLFDDADALDGDEAVFRGLAARECLAKRLDGGVRTARDLAQTAAVGGGHVGLR